MSDIIKVLPDNIANQIAAGEVIQRPASVIKELVENSVDSGASVVNIMVNDAGRSLIRVTDNGNGMSETDARLSFERHATSKITKADDLFAIHTFGFRGEALASIVSVAQVEMKTRREDDGVGTVIEINGSQFIRQESVSCPVGTTISVRNLFFNVPARRKFLKSDATEFSKIVEEFQRVALSNPGISMTLSHNGKEIYRLSPTNLKQRITGVFGKSMDQELIPLRIDTSVVQIDGYIGKPECARKSNSHNFFFVNNRFFKHVYFYRTIMQAYGNLINAEAKPVFFVYFNIPPESIDVNIHPTKTEIKFENEQIIFKYLNSAVKESLGKSNMMPSIDFDSNPFFDLPPVPKDFMGNTPEIKVNTEYNPFKVAQTDKKPVSFESRLADLKKHVEVPSRESASEQAFLDIEMTGKRDHLNTFLQIKGKYILTSFKSGIIYIDQRRAHKRILFEEFLEQLNNKKVVTEKIAFPETVTVNAEEYPILNDLLPELIAFGFDIGEFGKNTFIIHGIPAGINSFSAKEFVHEFLHVYRETNASSAELTHEMMAGFLADASCIKYGKVLEPEEMQYIFDKLFACRQPSFTPSGKQVFIIVPTEEIDKQFR